MIRSELLIRFTGNAPDELEWRVRGASGQAAGGGRGTPAEIAAQVGRRRAVLLAPAAQVLLTGAAVPSRKPQHIRQAVPYLLEEQLTEELGALHFAIGPRAADGRVAVAVVRRERLHGWLAACAEAGLDVVAAYPETLAVPLPEDGWALAGDDRTLLLRSGPAAGLALDGPAAGELLTAALAEAEPPPERIVLYGDAAQRVAGTALPERQPTETAPLEDGLAALFERGLDAAGEPGLDLLQGEFARDAGRRARWASWRRPAALAACLLLVLVAGRYATVRQLDRESERLDAALERTFRAAFPEATRVVDPVAQMRQSLARLDDAGDVRFLDLLAAAGSALAQQPDWQVAGLSYREQTLQLQLRMPAFDHFDRLRERFADDPELVAEIGSLGSVEGEVRGSVTLRRAGS